MTCNYRKLQLSGKPYPRTCPQCGLGPCKWPDESNVRPATLYEELETLVALHSDQFSPYDKKILNKVLEKLKENS